MQKKQNQEPQNAQNIMATVLQSIPKEANITKIDYEGPRIALYTDKPKFLMENNLESLTDISKARLIIKNIFQRLLGEKKIKSYELFD